MLINDIDKMDSIIQSSKHLSWSGWDVVYLKQDDYAEFHVDGYFDKPSGQWYRKSIYSCNENGWSIPDSVVL